jgi:hypothetical protein
MVIAISVIADDAPAISWAWCSAASARCSARGLGVFRGLRDVARGLVDRGHQHAQLVDGVVDGVGDRAGEVSGDRGARREVAVGEPRELVEQAQDGLLVALVGRGGLRQAPARVHRPLDADHHQRQHDQHAEGERAAHVELALALEVVDAIGGHAGGVEQLRRALHDRLGGLARLLEIGARNRGCAACRRR